jgi:hypothetical protein
MLKGNKVYFDKNNNNTNNNRNKFRLLMMTPLQDKFISSYANQLDDIVLEDGSSGTTRTTTISGGSNNKWNEFICKFIRLLSTIIQYPLVIIIMMAIFYDKIIVSAVGSGLFLLKILVLDLFLFKMGKIQNWPNKVSKK